MSVDAESGACVLDTCALEIFSDNESRCKILVGQFESRYSEELRICRENIRPKLSATKMRVRLRSL